MAARHGIPLTPGAHPDFSDRGLRGFAEEYSDWSTERDAGLLAHLTRTPNLFRVYLPYSDRVFHLACQILWYLDEIIIKDPIPNALAEREGEEEPERLQRLFETLVFLSAFREPIEQGYINFVRRGSLTPQPDEPSPTAQSLIMDDGVRQALLEATYIGAARRPSSTGELGSVYQMTLDTGGVMGFHFNVPAHTRATSPIITVGEILPKASLEEVIPLLGSDVFELMQRPFQREIDRTLVSITTANQLNAAVLLRQRGGRHNRKRCRDHRGY